VEDHHLAVLLQLNQLRVHKVVLIVRVRIVQGVEDRIVLAQRALAFPKLLETEAVVPFHRGRPWDARKTQRVFAHGLLNL
jgi:hypothetical protein